MKKVYLDEIEEKSVELANYSKNDIAKKIEELRLLPTTFIWEGPVKEKYISDYNKKIEKLNELNNNMRKIAEFLVHVKDDYTDANRQIDNAYEELINSLKLKKDDDYGM